MRFTPTSLIGRWLHWLFEASLIIKGTLAAGEALGGLGLMLTPNHAILAFVGWLTSHELTQDPTDDMALWFEHVANAFSIQTQQFYSAYLLGHGALKLTMVLMLARRIIWAYPLAMLVLAGFVTYQLIEGLSHGGSVVLLALAALDSIMIVLVWREWGILRLVERPE